METKYARACLQSSLKVVNSTLGIVGIAMILYGLWMIRAWKREIEELSFDDFKTTTPWSKDSNCRLNIRETAIGADIFLNSDWEKDLPNDPAGRFKDFKDFVKSNFDTFKWIGLLIILAQGLSILVAMVLRSIGPHNHDDSDNECAPARLPLIKHGVQPAPYVGAEQSSSSKATNAWKTKM